MRVDFGDWVVPGQEIAKSGETVHWSGPHLHFELRDLTKYELKDRPFKPSFTPNYIKDIFTPEHTYVANHDQALIDLSIKFYGTEKGIEILRIANPTLKDMHSHKVLPRGTKIKVPCLLNY